MNTKELICPHCDGTGKVTVEYRNKEGNNTIQVEEKCECQIDPDFMEIEKKKDVEKI